MIVTQVKAPVNLFLKKMSGFFRLARLPRCGILWAGKTRHYRRLFFPGKETTMRIMAIDYGDAHTGIAISDPPACWPASPPSSTPTARTG